MRSMVLGAVLALTAAAPAFADVINLDHTITVDGAATIYVDPDHASMTLGVVTAGKTVSDALRQNNVKMNAVIDAVKAQGVTSSQMQTATFSIGQQHPRMKDGGYDYNQISGYEVTNSLTVTVSDLTKVGAIIDAAANAGANTSNNVVFEVSNREELLDKVRAEAMKNAKHKADMMANAVGSTVGGLITVGRADIMSTESEFAPMAAPPPPPPPPPGTAILPGQLTVSANVTAVFALK